ncbi:MAG: UDP-N-acetylmuramate dehydrogenase [Bdellovibrionales bacterium]|jgi:UDP-N-acetylmuramate dehydrogenase
MTDTPLPNNLLSHLPVVRGKLTANAPLKDNTWFGVGGNAEALFKPEDTEDLATFLRGCPSTIPLTVIGVASNLLIRDGGVAGVVVKLGPAFASITTEGEIITAGTAALDLNIARAAQKAGIAGLEFLSGIPGTLGGALRMNAGAHGGEIKDIVTSITALDRTGHVHTLTPQEMGFAYRHSAAPSDWIFTSATLRGRAAPPEVIATRMKEIAEARAAAQPLREKTGGSTFANPEGHKAWELIDKAGCRGLTRGGAMMSEKHCNFMINTGSATAADLEALGEEVRRRVHEQSGIELQWEIRRIGVRS